MANPNPSVGRLYDRVAIITGSSSGIGRAIAVSYAQEGAKIACVDLTPHARPEVKEEAAIPTHELLLQQGADAVFIKADVSNEAEMEDMTEQTVAQYGRLDIIVNNAAVQVPPQPIHESPTSSLDKVMEVNARSVFLGCKLAISQMLKQEPHETGDRGWIVNIASVAGLVGCPTLPAYSASKGAVIALTKQVAIDYAKHRVHCNVICPGYVDTAVFAAIPNNEQIKAELGSLHPFRGLGTPRDVAGPAVFLASDDARWMTGVVLTVDGGLTAR